MMWFRAVVVEVVQLRELTTPPQLAAVLMLVVVPPPASQIVPANEAGASDRQRVAKVAGNRRRAANLDFMMVFSWGLRSTGLIGTKASPPGSHFRTAFPPATIHPPENISV
jgi:hypothetical protein